MFLIGVAPVSAQIDVVGLLGIGAFLAVLLAVAIVLHVVTAPRSHHGAVPSGPSDQKLGPAV
jgi:hypothetical protein